MMCEGCHQLTFYGAFLFLDYSRLQIVLMNFWNSVNTIINQLLSKVKLDVQYEIYQIK